MHTKTSIKIFFFVFLLFSLALPCLAGTWGDVNGDNNRTIIDSLMVAQFSVGISPPGFDSSVADVDGNGNISIIDALMIAQYSVGLITTFPVENEPKDIAFAGVRSSSYGPSPFPQAPGWERAIKKMQGYFPGSTPAAVWIVGEIWDTDCHLFFPSPGNSYPDISFESSQDKHEAYLDYFDEAGIKVYLQVEPGNAQVISLIDLVLSRYGHHPCVIGFGVDVEWFQEPLFPGWGNKVSDTQAREWEERVRSYNPAYRLFLKHWDRGWMPPQYRGELVFITDSQGFGSLNGMVDEMTNYWAKHFSPNPVGYQIGYEADRSWWGQLDNPCLEMGKALAEATEQECSVYWVDFTLDILLD